MSDIDPSVLALIPTENGEPVFTQPWEAQAFAMVVNLHAKGAFTWSEWAGALSANITEADQTSDYYHRWLSALESLVTTKAMVSSETLRHRKDQWERAALATPHGNTILLENDPQFQSS